MSYILDALRQAERERHLGQPPSLTAPPPAAEPGRRRFGWWLTLGLGLGLLNAALLAFFLIRPQPATPPVIAATPAPAPTAPAAIAPTPAATAPVATVTPGTPPVVPARPPVEDAPARKAPPAMPRQEPISKPVAPVAARSPVAPAQEPISKPVTPARRERREPAASPPPVTPGSVTLAPEPEPVPPLETLSASARRGIPALNLDIHIYSAAPDKRFVVINGRRYREGERLGEGPVLESVTRDGAILRQDGQRFRLSVRR